jgi:hypothetical protein
MKLLANLKILSLVIIACTVLYLVTKEQLESISALTDRKSTGTLLIKIRRLQK